MRSRALCLAVAAAAVLSPAPDTLRAQESRHDRTAAAGVAPEVPAPVEANDYLAYTDYDQMVDFLEDVAERSRDLSLQTLVRLPGETPADLSAEPALLLARLHREDAEENDLSSPRVAVLIIASQHGDEQSGKEATLRIVRDLAVGALNPLLDVLDVYAVPMPNPWGTATGQRENARGVDLNRDHARLSTPTVAALHALFARHRPEVVLDLHEMGLAAYDAEIGLATHPNADSALIKFGRYRIMPYVANELARRGFSFHEYVIAMPEPGTESDDTERYYTYGPLPAAYARNAFALRGAISMLLEAASSREIHDLGRRTEVHYTALRAALEVIANAAGDIRAETTGARRRADEPISPALGDGGREGPGNAPFVLRATYQRDPRQPALTWLVREPEGINVGTTERWQPAIHPDLVIERPAGYLVSADQFALIAALERHGFRLSVLTRARRLRIGRYPVAEPMPAETLAAVPAIAAAEPAHTQPDTAADPVSATEAAPPPPRADEWVSWTETEVPAGTVYVDLRQADSLLLMALLEPWSQDSWFATDTWGAAPTGPWYPPARLADPIRDGLRAVAHPMGSGRAAADGR